MVNCVLYRKYKSNKKGKCKSYKIKPVWFLENTKVINRENAKVMKSEWFL